MKTATQKRGLPDDWEIELRSNLPATAAPAEPQRTIKRTLERGPKHNESANWKLMTIGRSANQGLMTDTFRDRVPQHTADNRNSLTEGMEALARPYKEI